jgi:hypothetical protein
MARPTTYLGLAEVADLLGIAITTAGMRRSRGQLPPPIAELKMGPLWRLSQFKKLLQAQADTASAGLERINQP